MNSSITIEFTRRDLYLINQSLYFANVLRKQQEGRYENEAKLLILFIKSKLGE